MRGYITDANSIARFEWIRSTFKLDVALIPESARWGNVDSSWTVDQCVCLSVLFVSSFLLLPLHIFVFLARFASDINNLYTGFLTGRAAICTNWLKTQNANFFKWNQPKFSLPANALVAPGTQLTVTTDAGTKVYYTITGVDPRLAGIRLVASSFSWNIVLLLLFFLFHFLSSSGCLTC